MASKQFGADDSYRFDESLDFDFDQYGGDPSFVKDDRSPVVKVGAGFKQGAKDYVKDPQKVLRFMRSSMPSGYGKAYDIGRESVEEIQSLYNNVRETTKPAVQAVKGLTNSALPLARGILPKKMYDRIKEMTSADSEYQYQQRSEEEETSARLESVLGEVFEAQKSLDEQRDAREDYKAQLSEGISQLRHKGQMEQLDQIRLAVSSLASYQDRVLVNYQKRSLELQYRQYWTSAESLKDQKNANKTLLEQMSAVVKNTGLPDYAKLNNKEAFLDQARNKFVSDVRDSLFSGGQSYVRQFGENARKQIGGFVNNFVQGFQLADSIASPMLQGIGQEDDGFGGSGAEEMLGGMGAEMAMDHYGTKLGNQVRKRLQKNKHVDRMDSRLGYGANNFGTMVNDFLTNPEKSWGRGEVVREMLARMSPNSSTETRLELPLMKDMQKERQFNYQDSKSLNEIIPGLLARIHREVRMFRTGDTDTPLLAYDFSKNRFSNDTELSSGLRKRFGEGSRAAGDIDKFLKDIDRGGNLSDAQRQQARSVLVNRTLKRGDTTAATLSKSETWGGGEDGEAIAGMFANYMRVKGGKMTSRHSFRRANNLQASIKSAVSQVGDSFEFVQEMVNLGQYDMLLRSGVVNQRGEIDLEAMGRMINGEEGAAGVGDIGDRNVPNAPMGIGSNHKTVNIDRSRFQFDTSGLEKQLQQTNNRLGGMATPAAGTDNARLESIDQTLMRIEEILAHTDEVGVAHFQHVGGDPEVKSYTSLFAHAADKAMGAGRAVGRHAKAAGRRALSTVSSLGGAVGQAGSFIGKLGMPRLGRLKNKLTGFFKNDVFVGLESKARLLSSVMEAGGYMDAATGKVIRSVKDIKGDIKDLEGRIILRASEFEDAYVSGQMRKRFTDFLGSAWTSVSGLLDRAANFIPNSLRSIMDVASRVGKVVRDKLPPYDVYVKGEKKPILFATLFKMGTYRSKRTNKVIHHPRLIDGELLDADNNIVLNEDQIKQGLVDYRGISIKSPLLRAFDRIASPIMGTLKTVLDFGADAFKWVGNKVKNGAAFVRGLLGGKLDIGIYSKRTGDILEEIRDFMYDTWGKKRKRIAGDMNGDGIRDNSLEDMAHKRKEEGEASKTTSGDDKDEKKGGMISRFSATLSGFMDKFRKDKKKDDEDEDDEDDGFGLSDAADMAEIADAADDAKERRRGRKGRKGRRGRGRKASARRTGKVGRFGKIGKGRVIKEGAKSIAKRGVFSTFLPRMLGRVGLGAVGAGATAASGALGAGSLLGAGLGMAGSAIGALVSWPGLIAAGVLYGGYMIYKRMKETKVTPLSTVRLAQYGIPVDDKEMVKKVFAFENMLQEHVKFDKDGWASVDRNDADPKALAELFGLKSSYQAQRFINWYDSRFSPVYVRALSQMKQMKVENPNLQSVESQVEAVAKEKYMDAVIAACENYHSFMKGPPGLLKLEIGPAEVTQIANEQRLALKRMEKAETGKTAAFKTAEDSSQLVGRTKSEQARLASENPNDYEVKDKQGNVLKNLTREEIANAVKDGATIRAVVDVPQNVLLEDPTRLDALTCIRYKTYGLKSMMMDKVQALMGLEALCMKYISATKNGNEFSAKSDQILMQCATVFGKENTTGRNAQEWKTWFNERFLPTFMPFIGAVYKLTGSNDYIAAIKKLTPAQQLKIANMLTGSAGVDGNRVAASVWDVRESPWLDYETGSNPDVVINNLETIKTLVAKIELQEPLNPGSKTASKSGPNASVPNPDINKPAIFTRGARNRTGASASSKNSQGMMATGDVVLGMGDKMSRLGEAMQIGAGNGRKWADLPNPTGSGWDALKDLIIEAGKATGIDPKILASYIAVESSFDPNAQPVGGNALGLGQHMPGTWSDMMKRYGAALGIPAGTPRTDPRASVLLTAMYLKQNAKEIGKNLKREVSVAEGYLGHFAGATGATDLLSADPNRIAADIRPAAAKNNPNIFYDKATKRPYTVREMLENLRNKLEKRPGELGVKNNDFSGSSSSEGGSGSATAAPAQQAGSQAVAEAKPDGRVANAGFGNPKAAVEQNARPGPQASMNAANIDMSVTANLKPSGPPLPATGKIELFLRREPSTDDGTFGALQFPDGTSLLTLELPWKNNKNGVSCIPAGTYKCAKRQTTSFGFAYEVKNVVGRSGILIHAGNSAGSAEAGKKADSAGCILLGQGRGQKGSQKIITSSKAAMKIFYDKMQDREFTLTVTAAAGEEMSQANTKETDNPTRGNIEKIAASAPQSTAGNLSAPITRTGSGGSPDSSAPPATESGMRAALANVRGPGTNTPTAAPAGGGGNSPGSLSRGFKPSAPEMAQRDANVLDTIAAQSTTAADSSVKLLESAIRREKLLERLVTIAEGSGKASAGPAKPAPAKATADVQANPINTGRKY